MIGRWFLHGVPAEFLSLLALWIDQEHLFLPKACFSVGYWTWFPHFSRVLHVRDSDCSWIIYPTCSLYTCCFWHVTMFLCHVSFPQNLTHCLSCTCTGISSGKPTSAASRGSFLSLLLCGLCVCHTLAVQRLPLGMVVFGSNFIFIQINYPLVVPVLFI